MHTCIFFSSNGGNCKLTSGGCDGGAFTDGDCPTQANTIKCCVPGEEQPVEPETCENSAGDSICEYWVDEDLCEGAPDAMRQHCKKACLFCGK